jgi:hypothetical protein
LYAAAAMDQAEAQARAEVAAAYVRPELFEPRVDLKHRLYLSPVLEEDLGHIRSHTMHTLMPICFESKANEAQDNSENDSVVLIS